MAMRAQCFEYRMRLSAIAALGTAGSIISVFTTMFTRIMTTQATEFIVIEHIGSSPQAVSNDPTTGQATVRDMNAFVQLKINTTEYFQFPDGSNRTPVTNMTSGIPNIAAPYPISVNYQPTFVLYPDVYILPGQHWDVLYILGGNAADALLTGEFVYVFIKYTLYDGTDAVLANQLLELGITVKPSNIDWLKRKLIEGKA